MAKVDDYLNKTVLKYWYGRLKTVFANKTELQALDDKVDEIISEGGEPNKIDTVKVNGVALTPDAQKAVDVTVPTSTSDLTNDGDGTSNFATESYVDENGGKIDVIKVNGTTQTITNKEVDIDLGDYATVLEEKYAGEHFVRIASEDGQYSAGFGLDKELAKDATKIKVFGNLMSGGVYAYTDKKTDELLATKTTSAQVQALIDAALAGITGVDFVLVDTLPATGQKGKIYLVPNGGSGSNVKDEYVWLEPTGGTAYFEKIGTTDIDLSGYWAKEELVAITTSEIDAIMDE